MEGSSDKPTIFVVDDATENLMILKAILAKDYSLKLFKNADDVLERASAFPPDLILLDVMMPGIDGFELCKRLKANPILTEVPVIFITAKNDVANEAIGFSIGASDFIHKPISGPVVTARVKTHLKIKFMLDAQRNKRREAETALDELSKLNHSIIAEADSGIMVFRSEGECMLANEAAAKIIGGSIENIRLTNFRENLTWQNSGLLKAAEEALQTGITQKINRLIHTTFGKDFWCMATLGSITRKDGPPYLLIMFSDVTAYKEIERDIIGISEETKRLVGQELHDDLGQQLTGIAFMSKVLSQRLWKTNNPDAQDAERITDMVNQAISKTRTLAQGLYPVELEEMGLRAMLKQYADNVESLYKTRCEFISNAGTDLNDSLAVINLFRISQEAINNAIKHGKASKITVKLTSDIKLTTLEIADNGCGIDRLQNNKTNRGLGMHTMQYRASLLGASIRIQSIVSGGTSVLISLPVTKDIHYAI